MIYMVQEEKHSRYAGGESFVIKTFLNGPMDHAKLKLLCRGKDLDVS